jgi:hypothetical protein
MKDQSSGILNLCLVGFQFREECHLQLKCDLLVGDQDPAYSFGNARNREDVAHRLQRFVLWEVSFEKNVDQNHVGFLQVVESHL